MSVARQFHARARVRSRRLCASLLFVAGCANAPAVAPDRFAADTALLHAMVVAEDARPLTAHALAPLRQGASSPEPALRAWAMRGIGRLERDSLAPLISPALEDSSAPVRAAAAVALAQSVHRGDAGQARASLLRRLDEESDPQVLGALAESLGRLRAAGPDDVRATAARLIALAGPSSELPDAYAETLLGVAKGLFFLTRRQDARAALPASVGATLQALASYRRDTDAGAAPADSATLAARRVRRLAVAASAPAGAASAALLDGALSDPDPWVRREAALAAGTLADRAQSRRLAERALADAAGAVRYEGLRTLGRLAGDAAACTLVLEAARDADAHVALQAIDMLGAGCTSPDVSTLLDSIAGSLPPADAENGGTWHAAAHALVALAAADVERARARLPVFVAAENPFVRAYGAAAATRLRDVDTLRRLAEDAHANVRTATIVGLSQVAGHAADAVYVAQLAQDDSQLLQSAAAALEGTRDGSALPALLQALQRVTARQRETERDARVALLERIAELGSAATATQLRSYVQDFDSAIARRAAEAVSRWTGETGSPSARPLASLPVPSPAELAALSRVRLVLEMQQGGEIELRPLPYVAPTNVARFVRLAREGYYDGLTLHRVVPNFVLQGGSPGANEYAGDGPYTRDEVGAANWRGTAGLSTRGRDTGDGQLYINLVDNIRLDHDYTVWAEITRGMEVADRVLEGAVIRRVLVR